MFIGFVAMHSRVFHQHLGTVKVVIIHSDDHGRDRRVFAVARYTNSLVLCCPFPLAIVDTFAPHVVLPLPRMTSGEKKQPGVNWTCCVVHDTLCVVLVETLDQAKRNTTFDS